MNELSLMEDPTVSIVIPTYNRSEMLHRAMESLIRQETNGKFSYEVLVIDDASTDGTREVVLEIARRSPVPVRYIQGEGKGCPRARNRAVAESRGEWLAFFDDDELAEPDWLKELFAFAVKASAHLVGGRCILAISEGERNMLGPVCRAMFGELPSCGQEQKCQSRFLPGSGNMLVKRIVFDTIGVFDETMLTGGCDRDLVLRAQAAGFVVGRASGAVIRHVIPSHRFTSDYIRWYSLLWGASFAYIDWKRWERWKTVLACIARIGQAMLVNLPLLLLGYIRRSQTEILDRKALLWRAVGYSRKTLFLLASRLFPQEQFFARLEFRKERETFPKKPT